MWKAFFNLLARLLTLARDTDRNKTEIERLREELDNLTLVVHDLAHEIRRVAEHEAHEREKWALKLENEFLRSQRQAPGRKPKALPSSSE